jgi:hypothetical protein
LTQAAKKYKVVTQMGNHSSNDGTRIMKEWFAGLIGDVHMFMLGQIVRFGLREFLGLL